MAENDNMRYYGRFAVVPQEAQKRITGGKLNGKTDINPMWRIKSLTEVFGPWGFGIKSRIVEHWESEAGGEKVAWVRIELFVRDPETKEWSEPIEGVGGSKVCGKGMGDGINDEAFKMAETDAISVACKKLGMGATIYWDADRTKYTAPAQAPAPAKREKPVITEGCEKWNAAITYCRDNGKKADALRKWYTLDERTENLINSILEFDLDKGE